MNASGRGGFSTTTEASRTPSSSMLVLLVMLVAEVVAGVRITASDIFESSLVVTCPLVLLVPTRKDDQITQESSSQNLSSVNEPLVPAGQQHTRHDQLV